MQDTVDDRPPAAYDVPVTTGFLDGRHIAEGMIEALAKIVPMLRPSHEHSSVPDMAFTPRLQPCVSLVPSLRVLQDGTLPCLRPRTPWSRPHSGPHGRPAGPPLAGSPLRAHTVTTCCAVLDGPEARNFNGAVERHADGGLVMAYRNYLQNGTEVLKVRVSPPSTSRRSTTLLLGASVLAASDHIAGASSTTLA